jgi:hypothetical protein
LEKGTLDKGACLGRVWRRARLTKGVPGKVLKKGTLDKGRAWEGFGEKGTARHGTHGKGRAWEGFGEGHSTARMEKGALGEGLEKGTARHAWKRARLGRVLGRARREKA